MVDLGKEEREVVLQQVELELVGKEIMVALPALE
jgi:hypothetical protein